MNSAFAFYYDDRRDSDKPLPDTIFTFVNQLKDLLDALKISEGTVGLSMGAPVTAAFIESYPRYVRKHMLIDPAVQNALSYPVCRDCETAHRWQLLIGLFGSDSLFKVLRMISSTQNSLKSFKQNIKYNVIQRFQTRHFIHTA